MAALSVAFEAPDNYSSPTLSSHRPIDLDHLARQTAGDKDLELEVLNMFARQARNYIGEMASGDAETIAKTAHKLKAAALAIDAAPISQIADKLEQNSNDAATLAQLAAAVVDAENFILGLNR